MAEAEDGAGERGPATYENWRAKLSGFPESGAHEVALFSDARFELNATAPGSSTGVHDHPVPLGPYIVFNAIAGWATPQRARPALFLRSCHHRSATLAPSSTAKSLDGRHHGGSAEEEIAALLSLELGVRLRAGEMCREFNPGEDPRGHPYAPGYHPAPVLLGYAGDAILPNTCGSRTLSLETTKLTQSYPVLAPATASTLIKAARLYQQAIWIADGEPNLAWLLLVSAIEAPAAGEPDSDDPVEVLEAAFPDFVKTLRGLSAEGVSLVASQFWKGLRATSRFIKFCQRHMPAAPPQRPPDEGQVEWTDANLKNALSVIYDRRSRALHDGTPFPRPMCQWPVPVGGKVRAERPLVERPGSNVPWKKHEVPMHLHTFEHLVRGVLLRWWDSCRAEPRDPAGSQATRT